MGGTDLWDSFRTFFFAGVLDLLRWVCWIKISLLLEVGVFVPEQSPSCRGSLLQHGSLFHCASCWTFFFPLESALLNINCLLF